MKITPKLVRETRQRLGETQAEFGRRFGVNQGTVCRWEKPGFQFPATTRIAVEAILAQIKTKSEKARLLLERFS